MTGMIVSYKTYTEYDGNSIFYLFPVDTTEIIALPLIPSIYASDEVGYVMVEDKFIKAVHI